MCAHVLLLQRRGSVQLLTLVCGVCVSRAVHLQPHLPWAHILLGVLQCRSRHVRCDPRTCKLHTPCAIAQRAYLPCSTRLRCVSTSRS